MAASTLDNPETQRAVLESLEAGATADEAAAVAGVTRQAVARYAKVNPGFRVRVDESRGRARVHARQSPRAHDLGAAPTGAAPSAAAIVAWSWDMATGDDQPPALRCKALDILAEYLLGPEIRAQVAAERRAESDAETTGQQVVILQLPTKSPVP